MLRMTRVPFPGSLSIVLDDGIGRLQQRCFAQRRDRIGWSPCPEQLGGQRKQRRHLLPRGWAWGPGHGANLAWELERGDRNRQRIEHIIANSLTEQCGHKTFQISGFWADYRYSEAMPCCRTTSSLPTIRPEPPSRSTCFDFLDDLRDNATCFARRIAAPSNLRPAPASWTRSTDLPAGAEGSSRNGSLRAASRVVVVS